MIGSVARRALARSLLRVMRHRASEIDEKELPRSAVVFAPHADDEVLGCGGTVLAKIAARARVTIVFMTNGSASHPAHVSAAELRALRRSEALEATRLLGVVPEDVVFLDFQDHALSQNVEAAIPRVEAILRERATEQVFVPCEWEWHVDHVATHEIVSRAIEEVHLAASVYAYSVYMWMLWPFCRDGGDARGLSRELFKRSMRTCARMARDATHYFVVEEVPRKGACLAARKTQVEKPPGKPSWRVLGEWGRGDFLSWQGSRVEFYFRRSSWCTRR